MINTDLYLLKLLLSNEKLEQNYLLKCRCGKEYRIMDNGLDIHALLLSNMTFAKEYRFADDEASFIEMQIIICKCGRPLSMEANIRKPLNVSGYTFQLDQTQLIP